jgi:hypothetical protein
VLSSAGEGLTTYRSMADVLKLLGNRTLTFVGDSIASQHAHATECSWSALTFSRAVPWRA